MKSSEFYESRATDHGGKIPELTVPKLTTQGLKIINQYHHLENAFVCNNEKDFGRVLDLLENNPIPNLDLMLSFSNSGHTHAIKVERRDGKNNFILIDSIGLKNGVLLYMQETLDMVQKHCPTSDIYCLISQRQFDPFSCVTYTAKDLAKMAQSYNFHQELRIDAKERVTHIYQCKMPARFEIFSQSEERAFKKFPEESVVFQKHGEEESFKEKFYRERITDGVKTPFQRESGENVPSLIYHFSKKYAEEINRVLENCTTDQSQEELKAKLLDQDSSSLTIDRLFAIGRKWEEDFSHQPSHPHLKNISALSSVRSSTSRDGGW